MNIMENNEVLLKPDEDIKPKIDVNSAKLFIEQLYGFTVHDIIELNGYDDKNFRVEVDSSSSRVSESSTFVFKVMNSLDSKSKHVESEHDAMFLLRENEVNCPVPVKNKNGHYYSLEKIEFKKSDKIHVNWHIMRLLVHLSGLCLNKVPLSKIILCQAGELAGKITDIFLGWNDPILDSHDTIWALQNMPRVRNMLFAIDSLSKKQLIEKTINEFENVVLTRSHNLRKSVIHGDMNNMNILVEHVDADIDNNNNNNVTWKICGILDFGDMSVGFSVFELAVAIMYMMLECKTIEFLDAGGYVLAGYLKNRNLSDTEWAVLKTCVAARYAQSLVMGAYSYSLHPTNEYLLDTASDGWSQLEILQNESSENIVKRWKNIVSINSFHD